MTSWSRPLPFLLLLVLLPSAAVSRAGGGAAGQDGAVPLEVDERVLVLMESRGLANWMPDPRDAGLLGALALLDERLAELPDEIEAMPPLPPGALEALSRLATRPSSLRLIELPAGVAGIAGVPLRVELIVLLEDVERARELSTGVAGLLETIGYESEPGAPDVTVLNGPVPAWLSVREEALVLAVGAPAGDVVASLAPVGPAFSASIEISRLFELALELGADPGLATLSGMIGPNARLDTSTYFANGAQETRLTLVAQDLLSAAAPLQTSLLDALPTDAIWAFASSISPRSILRALQEGLGAVEEDPFAELEEMLGVELDRDLLAHLGAGWAAYCSEGTGGGFMSTTGLWEVQNHAALAASLDRVAAALSDMGRSEANGYVRVDAVEIEHSTNAWTVRFPGFPIPVQPTLALREGQMVLALHPAGARAALRSALDTGGLQDVPAIAELLATADPSRAALCYLDAPGALRDGYGFMLAIGQLLENALSSPTDPAREVPEVVPTLAELRRNARPWTASLSLEQGILRLEARADASAIARSTAQFGLMPAFFNMLGQPTMLPFAMLASQRSSANEWQEIAAQIEAEPEEPWEEIAAPADEAQAELMAILAALTYYAQNNGGEYPEVLQVLVTPDSNGASYLQGGEDALTDPWGRPYLYFPPAPGQPAARVLTRGSDGQVGGVDDAADIGVESSSRRR